MPDNPLPFARTTGFRTWAGLILAASLLSGCDMLSNSVTTDYATLAEARAGGLGGWLPDVVPASATDIHVSTNMDLGFSVGEFWFASADAPAFFMRLEPGAPPSAPFDSWSDTVVEYCEDGYLAHSIHEGRETTVFFCHEQKKRCDYFSWTNR
ncbi:hypothetical protein [Arenimonas sp.]|uniref:hypothetical protein n=1 Tax=Arenimonas sp. TaxID=1872635 RepID=UPI0039E4E42A